MPTLFERIVAREIPADIVFQDDRVTAFRDIQPRAPVHILIVPNRVIATTNDIADSDEALVGHMVIVARDLALREGRADSGYRLIVNCNRDSGQEVFHLHLHLLGGKPMGPMVAGAAR
jgi:histidine triad (HIT) family protein